MRNFLILLIGSSFLFSCGPKISAEQQEHLDELIITHDTLAAWFKAIDTPTFDSIIKVYNERKDFIKSEMQDTLNKEAVLILNSFLLQASDFELLEENFPIMKEELNTAREQLQLMQKDIDARILDADLFKEYIEIEYENTQVLQGELDRFISTYLSQVELYQSMVIEVDSIISDYKERKLGS